MLEQCEETHHVQGQRNPSKMVGAGAAATRPWSGCEERPHTQGQRRSPSSKVGGVNSHLESNPMPARDALRAQANLMCTRT